MNLPGLADRLFHLLLQVYPRDFSEIFGDEMRRVFVAGARDASREGRLGRFFLRELSDAPRGLVKAHAYGWKQKWETGIRALRSAASTAGLPPLPPDGRHSRRQALLETGLFLLTALLLIWGTYRPPTGLSPGWHRDLDFLGRVITPVALPVFLLGLVRGLPRWAYPFAGLLLAHAALTTGPGIWIFLAANLLAGLLLGMAALATNPEPVFLPAPVRRIGQSLAADWTRLSFALYGALPLLILAAFDDGFTNNRTPYLALAAAAMAAGAWVYARATGRRLQIGGLLLGTMAAVWAAWLDRSAFGVGLANWAAVPHGRPEDYVWLLRLWLTWTALILLPALPSLVGRTLRPLRRI
jgi:hypothetical protein